LAGWPPFFWREAYFMDNLLDAIVRAARRCERAAGLFNKPPVDGMIQRLTDACQEVGKAWSGSFLGYQATVYIAGLRPARPGEHFSSEWGPMRSNGDWVEYAFEGVKEAIEHRAGVRDVQPINEAVSVAGSAFESGQEEIMPALDAILASGKEESLKELRDSIVELRDHVSMEEFARSWIPRGQQIVRDPRAQSGGGFQVPHHLRYQAWLLERASYGIRVGELAKRAKQAVKYLKYTMNMKGNTVAKTDGAVFIGHGRSAAWRDLKDFLQDRLGLQWDEFNRETPAGHATKERLEAMLDKAVFAFLVMTAEDEQLDGTMQARANVIHEAGLFQGRLGFERAIILLEEGCSEFSNIVGLGQIRFPKGNIMSKSEDIRKVLEREKIV
jgi:predicted nucleotide-binding protein